MGIRDFIEALGRQNLLYVVERRVDWKYELGRIAREINAPILFVNIKDYPNKKVFVNGLASYVSIATALGISERPIRHSALYNYILNAFSHPIEPIMVENAAVLENRITQAIDLTVLPVPWWSEIDSGRYIGTWHLNITRDPETGLRNIGVYRMQLLGHNEATVSVSPRSHLAMHLKKAESIGRDLPMAVAIGVDERIIMSAAAAPAYGIDEFALAGGLMGKPTEVFGCKTQPLEAPVDSEIVLEGYIKSGARVQDGPFLDYAGIPSINPSAYLFVATALYFRNDHIFRGTAVGRPGAEDHQLYSILASAGAADFHGSRIRRRIQNFLLRKRAFKLFQLTGRIGYYMMGNKSPHGKGG
jgi:UbiD family decarboxylase